MISYFKVAWDYFQFFNHPRDYFSGITWRSSLLMIAMLPFVGCVGWYLWYSFFVGLPTKAPVPYWPSLAIIASEIVALIARDQLGAMVNSRRLTRVNLVLTHPAPNIEAARTRYLAEKFSTEEAALGAVAETISRRVDLMRKHRPLFSRYPSLAPSMIANKETKYHFYALLLFVCATIVTLATTGTDAISLSDLLATGIISQPALKAYALSILIVVGFSVAAVLVGQFMWLLSLYALISFKNETLQSEELLNRMLYDLLLLSREHRDISLH